MYTANENNRLDKVIDTLIQFGYEHGVPEEEVDTSKTANLLNNVLPGLNVLGEERNYYRQQ